jgi:hypothetical protein
MNAPLHIAGQSFQRSNFFNAFLEGFQDGILILTEQQQCLHRNHQAQQYCQDLAPSRSIPPSIWRICQALMDSREIYPHQNCVLDDVIPTDQQTYRVEVQWLDPGNARSPILVTIEPQTAAQLKQIPWWGNNDWLPASA